MGRIAEINARLIEIRGLLAQDGADIDALEAEVRSLTEEKRSLMDAQSRRQGILDQIAGDNTLHGMTQESMQARSFNPTSGNSESDAESSGSVFETVQYRSAFYHALQNRALTAAEQRVMDQAEIEKRALSSASNSAAHVIPTQTQNEIIRKMIKLAPMMEEITLLNVPGNLSLIVESGYTEAKIHTENAEGTDDDDKPITVTLGGYEVMKLMSISAKLEAMSISAFEDWLTTILAEGCVRKIEDWIINGTGTNEPTGIEKANSWSEGNNLITFAGAAPTYAEVCKLISLLPAEYDGNAKMLMNKKAFWTLIQPIRDDGKAPIVRGDNGMYTVMGYPVLISAKVHDGTIYLGDYKQYYGNMAAPITVASSAISGFRRNAIDYRGTCIFDGKPIVGKAFVKAKTGA